jgi:hypothetical protein
VPPHVVISIADVQMEENCVRLEDLHAQIKAAQASATQFNTREFLFGVPPTDYDNVKKLRDTLDPFHQFWSTANRCAMVYIAAVYFGRWLPDHPQ